MRCVQCDNCTVIDKLVHADRICRPCTFEDVFSNRGEGKCGQALCLLKLKYSMDHGFADGACASDMQEYLDFAAGVQQDQVYGFYTGGPWKKLWTGANILSFKADSFQCANIPWQTGPRVKWMPFSQYAISTHANRIATSVTTLRSVSVASGDTITDLSRKLANTDIQQFIYSNHSTPLLRVVQRYNILSAQWLAKHIFSLPMRKHHTSTKPHAVQVHARILHLQFLMLPHQEITVETITLTFQNADTSSTLILQIDDIMQESHSMITTTTLESVAGSLSNATLVAAVFVNTRFVLQVHDASANTILRSTVMLQSNVSKIAVVCSANTTQESTYRISKPTDFDALHAAYRHNMCTADFGV